MFRRGPTFPEGTLGLALRRKAGILLAHPAKTEKGNLMREGIAYSSTVNGSFEAVPGKFVVGGLASAGETLRLSAVMILGMAIGAFILGCATPITLTPKAMIADRDNIFSGRLINGFDQGHFSAPAAGTAVSLSSQR